MYEMQVVTLSNGVRVANLCCPDAHLFEDGVALPGCPIARWAEYQPTYEEATAPMVRADDDGKTVLAYTVTRKPVVPAHVRESVKALLEGDGAQQFDVLLIPPRLMTAWRASGAAVPDKLRTAVASTSMRKRWALDKYGNGVEV